MLPRSRVLSALFVGLGVALIVAGLISPRLIHATPLISTEPSSQTFVLHDDTHHLTRQLHAQIQDPTNADTLTENIGVTLRKDDPAAEMDGLISATVWNVAVDRHTGALGEPIRVRDQLVGPAAPAPAATGTVWLHFPVHPEPVTYPVLDDTLRGPVDAVFIGEEEQSFTTGTSREVYRYRQVIDPTNVALRYAGNTTLVEGERAYLFHSGTREFTVDKETGMILNVVEDIDDYYATAEGERLADVLRFSGELSSDAQAARASLASDLLVAPTLRIWEKILIAAGALIVLVSLWGAFRL